MLGGQASSPQLDCLFPLIPFPRIIKQYHIRSNTMRRIFLLLSVFTLILFHDITVAFEPPFGINAVGEPTQIKPGFYLDFGRCPYFPD